RSRRLFSSSLISSKGSVHVMVASNGRRYTVFLAKETAQLLAEELLKSIPLFRQSRPCVVFSQADLIVCALQQLTVNASRRSKKICRSASFLSSTKQVCVNENIEHTVGLVGRYESHAAHIGSKIDDEVDPRSSRQAGILDSKIRVDIFHTPPRWIPLRQWFDINRPQVAKPLASKSADNMTAYEAAGATDQYLLVRIKNAG